MKWKKLGLVWNTTADSEWSVSHAMAPTPYLINNSLIRVFLATRDQHGRSRPIYVDVSVNDPTKVIAVCEKPLMDVGNPGTFDENGVLPLSIVLSSTGNLMMHYSGFEICKHIPYRIFTGLAFSEDDGKTFERYSQVPVLDRTDKELYFRCASYVLHENNTFRLWYVAGSEWLMVDGQARPVYDLRYQESLDGIQWSDEGQISLALTNPDEHGFGRPWVIKRGPADYRLFYSIRRRSLGAYRLGYAESVDGIRWVRKDGEMGLDVSPGMFDSDAIMYSAVISVGGKTYCFYNGNDFGRDGFAVAELIDGF